MQAKVLVVLVALSIIPIVSSRTRRFSKVQTNPLSKARCDLTCYDVSKDNRNKCRSQCRSQEHKPGTCPSSDTRGWASACVAACNVDSQCDGTQRCCHHECGSACKEPLDLLTLPGLPAMPVMDDTKEKRHSVLVRWSDGVGDAARAVPGRILYILEEQHHLGPKYEESKLGEWNMLLRTNKTKASLRKLLKPGRWYRFRVAAVSASGTRGFSAPSAPFTPRRGPRAPPPPKQLKAYPVGSENGTITLRLEWKEPRSDLPVVRYKVFWSRRARGLGGELNSVVVKHQMVPKDKTFVDIKDLQPNSQYFLQVQTISQFGAGKLRSEKADIFYNTTSGVAEHPPEALQKREKRIKNLKLNRIVWYNNKLKAKVTWEPVPNGAERIGRYYVHWKTIKCLNPNKATKELSAITEQTTFDIYELDYDCTYKVNINRSRKPKLPDSDLTFTVPGCDHFQRKINSTVSICNT